MKVKTSDKHPPVIICISSGKGGVGKTSFAVNLAASLASARRKVLLIDGDLGLANVDVVLGLNVRHNIRETVEEGRDPAALIVEISPGFYVLPASSGVPEMANLSYEDQALLTSTLEGIIDRFDYILVDTAAGLGESVLWFNNWARENIIILSPDPTAMTDAYALMKVLYGRYGRQNFRLLINNVKSRQEGKEVFDSMSAVLERFLKFKPTFLGAVPADPHVSRAIRAQKPFWISHPECRASMAVSVIASKISQM